jgi:hypothetical protein
MSFCVETPWRLARNSWVSQKLPKSSGLKWREYIAPKSWYLSTSLHGVKTRNNNIGILTALRTTKLTLLFTLKLLVFLNWELVTEHLIFQVTG